MPVETMPAQPPTMPVETMPVQPPTMPVETMPVQPPMVTTSPTPTQTPAGDGGGMIGSAAGIYSQLYSDVHKRSKLIILSFYSPDPAVQFGSSTTALSIVIIILYDAIISAIELKVAWQLDSSDAHK